MDKYVLKCNHNKIYKKGEKLTLTTPVIDDDAALFSGENWFFYWKIASSLWEDKLSKAHRYDRIIIPINWGFHSETGDKFDFGVDRPEANLKKLIEIIIKLDKQPVILLPLGPVPYLINGGVPYLLAKGVSFCHQKVWLTLSGDRTLHKIFSFYEPKVFRGYQRFVQRLHDYFEEHSLAVHTFGVRPFYYENEKVISYFADSSPSYATAFKRFLEQKRSEDNQAEEHIRNTFQEREVHNEFQSNMQELYFTTALETLRDYWDGVLDICFIGGTYSNLLNRSLNKEDEVNYFNDVVSAATHRLLPSTVLLGQERSELLRQFADSYVVNTLSQELFSLDLADDAHNFEALRLFTLFTIDGHLDLRWQSDVTGPWELLSRRYRGAYQVDVLNRERVQEVIEEEQSGILLFKTEQFSAAHFNLLLKLFMHGKRIIVDIKHLSNELTKKLEMFFLENHLEVQKVKFRTLVRSVSLGEGQMLLYNSDELAVLDPLAIRDFWEKLFSLYLFSHPIVEGDKRGIIQCWMTRTPRSNELKFESIRRLMLYNVASYKQHLKIKFPRNFLVIKMLDEQNVKAVVENGELDISFNSQGAITIDFGFISNEI